jgi:hypothetical protein
MLAPPLPPQLLGVEVGGGMCGSLCNVSSIYLPHLHGPDFLAEHGRTSIAVKVVWLLLNRGRTAEHNFTLCQLGHTRRQNKAELHSSRTDRIRLTSSERELPRLV